MRSRGGKAPSSDTRKRGGKAWSTHNQAAGIIAQLIRARQTMRGGASIKSLVFRDRVANKKQTYALCCETLRHMDAIKEVLSKCGFFDEAPGSELKGKRELVYVWVYELLFGQWRRAPSHLRPKQVAQRREAISQAFAALKEDPGFERRSAAAAAAASATDDRPRYLRINHMLVTDAEEEVVRPLCEELGLQMGQDLRWHATFPDVLELPRPKAVSGRLYKHRLVAEGKVVLQGLSSCMPAHALAPQHDWRVVDACAAPGNKTTQIASLMMRDWRERGGGGEAGQGGMAGHVTAFDIDERRFQRLQAAVEQCGASKVIEPRLRDFLSVDGTAEEEFGRIDAILLDPSCSGSGTAHTRGDHLLGAIEGKPGSDREGDPEKRRVELVAAFQERALRHALTKFPRCRRVVYSTCSVHVRENEAVVAACLPDAERQGFALARALPEWRRRGFPFFEASDMLVRVDPVKDKTDGFFVAVFERNVPGV